MDPQSTRKHFQFGISGLLQLTAVVAVGFSIGCLKNAKWEDGLFAAATTWIVIGLVNEIRDLYSAFRHSVGLSRDQQSGWWFAITWRGVLAMLLAGHFFLMVLLATGRVVLAGTEGGLLGPAGHDSLRSAIFAMSLLLIFAGFEGGTSLTSPRHGRLLLGLLATFAIVILTVLLLFERFFVFWLVHLACVGIAVGMQRVAPGSVWVPSEAREWLFLGLALLATSFVLLDLFCLRQLIRYWNGRIWRRTTGVGTLGTSLALTSIFPVWLVTRGFKFISPRFVEAFEIAPINRWIFGMLLVGIFVTEAARRMILAAKLPECDARWNWRRRPSAYYHEFRLVALFVAATILCQAARFSVEAFRGFPTFFAFTTLQFAQMLLESCIVDPRCQLWSVVFCLAVYRSVFGFARKSEGLCRAPLELPLSLFAIVWTGLLATVLMAVPICAALGVGLCLNCWHLPF